MQSSEAGCSCISLGDTLTAEFHLSPLPRLLGPNATQAFQALVPTRRPSLRRDEGQTQVGAQLCWTESSPLRVMAHPQKQRIQQCGQRKSAQEMHHVNAYALGKRYEGYGLVDRVRMGRRAEEGNEA